MVKNCVKCGANNEDNSNFCSRCGNNLSSTTIGPQVKSTPGKHIHAPQIIKSQQPASTISTAPGMCTFHKGLHATYICRRCGKAICANCTFNYMSLTMCPQCYRQIIPPTQMPFVHPVYPY
jgi:hypothetical protein